MFNNNIKKTNLIFVFFYTTLIFVELWICLYFVNIILVDNNNIYNSSTLQPLDISGLPNSVLVLLNPIVKYLYYFNYSTTSKLTAKLYLASILNDYSAITKLIEYEIFKYKISYLSDELGFLEIQRLQKWITNSEKNNITTYSIISVNETTSTLEQELYDNLINYKYSLMRGTHTVNNQTISDMKVPTQFLSDYSPVTTRITNWQYWWWMMFTFVIVFFNKISSKILLEDNLKINLNIYVANKSNGRWGDFIASSFPIFWCSNILLNSNMILKLIENHTESSVFTLRIRGKQWYWAYKLDVKLENTVYNPNKVLGSKNRLNKKFKWPREDHFQYNYHKLKFNFKQKDYYELIYLRTLVRNRSIKKNSLLTLNSNFNKTKAINQIWDQKNLINLKKNSITTAGFKRLLKYNKNFYEMHKAKVKLYPTWVSDETNKLVILKLDKYDWHRLYNRHFYTLQQQPKNVWYLKNVNMHNKKIKGSEFFNKKKFISKNRMISVHNTLLLPTKTNITLITNSFDVVHSWFIPGLGLKFDCVPGRSTHHTFKILKPGIYIGHCAEVCGRFHHNMPIKVIAVPITKFHYFFNLYYPKYRQK